MQPVDRRLEMSKSLWVRWMDIHSKCLGSEGEGSHRHLHQKHGALGLWVKFHSSGALGSHPGEPLPFSRRMGHLLGGGCCARVKHDRPGLMGI